ncbi:MAG: hypothetical protein E7235_01015 [Lachnospiraceae bacterium]|nr:hypothetical protein [Lachnospiraceae bacterium]
MKYYDFINNTISNNNNINWNYYNDDINTTNILNSKTSIDFIKQYFKNGRKDLPLILDPETANIFITNYFKVGQKETILFNHFNEHCDLPAERAIHTVSGFFLGLLVENCINGSTPIHITNTKQGFFPFSYLWFLTFLYHDYGYCVTERTDCPFQYPQHAPIPNQNNTDHKYCASKENRALTQIKGILGINLSPFRQFSTKRTRPSLEHAILRELTQNNNTISGYSKLHFSNGSTIMGHQYPNHLITRYMNYCINIRRRVDHGIVGGYLFYDRIIKNYLLAYTLLINETNRLQDLSDFSYKNKHFCSEQLTVFSYISDCILSHNIFKQNPDTRQFYELYQLDDLLEENFKTITYESNPLLYILAISDTIEPIKIYKQHNSNLSEKTITEAIEIEYTPGTRSLKFSSNSANIDINILYQKAISLTEWTSAKCSNLEKNSFTLKI